MSEATPRETETPTPRDPREKAARRRARVRGKRRRAEKGIALVLAMTSVAILFMLAQQIRENTVMYSTAAVSARDEVIAYYEAKSMVNLSRLLLQSEPTIRKVLQGSILGLMFGGQPPPQIPIWEQSDVLLGPFRKGGSNELAESVGVSMDAARGMGGLRGAHEPMIVDEDSKINVNGFARGSQVSRRVAQQLLGLTNNPKLEPFFTDRDTDDQHTDRVTLVGAMIDWADADQMAYDIQSLLASNVQGGGSTAQEDTVYENLHPPYTRKNAPYDSLEEMRLVRGLGDDDLWQAIIEPDATDPKSRPVTVWGQGLVNVNSAPPLTQYALACANAPPAAPACNDAGAMAGFVMAVSMIQGFTLSLGIPMHANSKAFADMARGQGRWGSMLVQARSLGFVPVPVIGDMTDSVTTESKVFSIYAESAVGLAHVRIHAVVDMRPQPAIPSVFLKGGQISAPPSSRDSAVAQNSQTGQMFRVTAGGGTVVYWRED